MSEIPAEFPVSDVTGARLDPVDNMPLFGEIDGVWMSRERYVQAMIAASNKQLAADLRASVEADRAAEAADPADDDDADA